MLILDAVDKVFPRCVWDTLCSSVNQFLRDRIRVRKSTQQGKLILGIICFIIIKTILCLDRESNLQTCTTYILDADRQYM
jgi:hypothetical protein